MNKNKFKFWNPQAKSFVENYTYKGLVDELFEPDEFLKPKQFLGIYDKNMKEVYEDDVVKSVYSSNEYKLGVIECMSSYGAYVIQYDNSGSVLCVSVAHYKYTQYQQGFHFKPSK